MEAQSIIDDLQIQINQIAKKLNDSSSKIQQSIYDDIIVELSKLDQTAGDIKTSVSNLKRIQIIKDNISKIVLSPEYKDDVEVFLSGFDELQLTMDTYFTAISEEFGESPLINQIKTHFIDVTGNSLREAGIDANVIQPIENILNLKDTSREFCDQRHGKYFHRKEVEAWANLSWAGKIQGTNSSNIFIYRGGYHCRHQLIPVSAASVPRSVIERAINEGYYQED
jgi:hypothetical protein